MVPKHPFLHYISRWLKAVYDKVVLWWTAKFFSIVIALFLSFSKRQRMSHNNGIAGRGWLHVFEELTIPENGFFVPGRQFPITIRHASATFLDDAMNCIRSISLKFSHEDFKSPFDIEMNTGQTSLFWNAASFLQFAKLRKEKWGIEYVEYYKLYPEGLKGAQWAGRRHATSFHNLHYYSKTPMLFQGIDQIKRYAKYRVLPFEDIKESGIPEDPSVWDAANQRILPHETRGRNYLKYEYKDRVQREGAKYRLQIQLRTANDDDDPEIFNNMVLWDETFFPWVDIASFKIDSILDWRESTKLAFSVNNMPKYLGILPAKSIYDYNSLNYMRSHSEFARKMRMLSLKIFGMVPPIPDNDNRNAEDWGK